MRCAIYVRATPAGFPIREQEKLCRDYCEEREFTVTKTYFDEYPNRQSFNSMMSEMDHWDACIFYTADRIHSSSKNFSDWSVSLGANGRNFAIVSNNIDTMGRNSAQMFGLLRALRGCDTSKIYERTSAGMKKVSGIGRKIGKPPYGYDSKYKVTGNPSDKGILVVNQGQADIVRIIFSCWDQDMSKNEIAKHLRKNNILTKAGKNEWASSTVRGIIDNKMFYQGKYVNEEGKEINYEWEAIL